MTLLDSNPADAPARLFDRERFLPTFVALMAIFLAFYFSELANFSLSIDEEVALFPNDLMVWVAQDRWAIYLIERFFLADPVAPYFPLFLFGLLASLAYMIVARLHLYAPDNWRVLLLFVLFSAFPTLYHMMDFDMAIVPVGIGLLVCALSLVAFDRALRAIAAHETLDRAIAPFVLQAVLGAVVIGLYQALILVIAAGSCGLFLLWQLRGPGLDLRRILLLHALLAGALLGGIVLGLFTARAFQWGLGVNAYYISGFVHLDLLMERPFRVVEQLLKEVWAVYGGRARVYGYTYVTFAILILLGLLAVTARGARQGAVGALLVFLYALGIALIPFAINLVSGGRLEYRALVAVPYAFWFFAAAATFSHIRWVQRIAIALVVIVSLQCLYTFTHFQAQKRLVLDHDKLLASEIYQRIAREVPDFDRSKRYVVDFYGPHEYESPYREIRTSTISASFFEWDGGNPYRVIAFMRALGYANLQLMDDATRKSMLPAYQKMPVWPAEGSVQRIGEVILVRLGVEPGDIHRRLIGESQ